MEVEEEFLPNLASMLEVSLVEGSHTVLSEGETRSQNCEIWWRHSHCAGDSNLGCYTVSLGEWSPTPPQVVVHSSSRSNLEDEGISSFKMVGNQSPSNTPWCSDDLNPLIKVYLVEYVDSWNSCNTLIWNICQKFCFHSVCSILLEPTEISGEANSNITSINGISPPGAKSCIETKVADVKCTPVEENEIHSKFIFIWQVLLKVLWGGNISEVRY